MGFKGDLVGTGGSDLITGSTGVDTINAGSGDVVVICGRLWTVSMRLKSSVTPRASVTRSRNVESPGPLGAPWISPVVELKAIPLGSDPLATDQVSGAVPPVAAAVCE